ncbi:MAG: 30S ribosomal protein S7 [Flavobacteriales bacterium]|jgi:small subunit ribosomal protein S7|nr:30S ribosomal protein S7 [Flavobacteriales bacterium]|tara:strand:+ start:30 stop:500 length:471 start_codon:yes stop_codon:yes gene_type:complete
MRKSPAKKRRLLPDAKFNDTMVTQFVNNMMYDGKKSTAFKIFYDALEIVESRVEDTSALDVWRKAVQNITPAVEVRSRRIGGATFQIPQPIRDARKLSMAMKWMIGYARKRNDKNMSHKLAAEIVAAFKEEGAAYKKKQDTHRMAEANKAFSHFRF